MIGEEQRRFLLLFKCQLCQRMRERLNKSGSVSGSNVALAKKRERIKN